MKRLTEVNEDIVLEISRYLGLYDLLSFAHVSALAEPLAGSKTIVTHYSVM